MNTGSLRFAQGDGGWVQKFPKNHILTLPETNIFAPENGWLEDDRFLLKWALFRGENVSFGEGKWWWLKIVIYCGRSSAKNHQNKNKQKVFQRGSLYHQPRQCIVIREIPQKYHRCILSDSTNLGHLMTETATVFQKKKKVNQMAPNPHPSGQIIIFHQPGFP